MKPPPNIDDSGILFYGSMSSNSGGEGETRKAMVEGDASLLAKQVNQNLEGMGYGG